MYKNRFKNEKSFFDQHAYTLIEEKSIIVIPKAYNINLDRPKLEYLKQICPIIKLSQIVKAISKNKFIGYLCFKYGIIQINTMAQTNGIINESA